MIVGWILKWFGQPNWSPNHSKIIPKGYQKYVTNLNEFLKALAPLLAPKSVQEGVKNRSQEITNF